MLDDVVYIVLWFIAHGWLSHRSRELTWVASHELQSPLAKAIACIVRIGNGNGNGLVMVMVMDCK